VADDWIRVGELSLSAYLDQERYKEAFTAHETTFKHQIGIWGEGHFETGVMAHRMGCHYERRGEMDKAMQVIFRRTLCMSHHI
jgi:hypothetical protein